MILDKFTKNYSDYLGKGIEIVYVLENETNDLEVYEYNSSSGKKIFINYYNLSYNSGTGVGEIKVPVNSTNYTFEMRDGKDFYFIITKESFGEKHIITNEN